ncbi:Protein NRT1/ PTR FAMILY 7.3 [Capsicum annuum]|nr:Protein NRT1/ PTR FAMILY 7.3 [Capsicum annuum]
MEISLFYILVYMISLGYRGYQHNIATFRADQFDERDPREKPSKAAFFSYFYLALNLGSLFSNTVLDYFVDDGMRALSFWAVAGSAFAGLTLFLGGTAKCSHFRFSGNPITRFSQVILFALKKWRVGPPENEDVFFESDNERSKTAGRKILHTYGFKSSRVQTLETASGRNARFLDRAALITSKELDNENQNNRNSWCLCPIS